MEKIYCCECCGYPTDKNGKPLDMEYDEATEYLRINRSNIESIPADCCKGEYSKFNPSK